MVLGAAVMRVRLWARRPRSSLLFALLSAIVAGGCVDPTGLPFPRIEETDFAPDLGIDLSEMTRIGGGVYAEDLVLGSGREARSQDSVVVDYQLHLADGRSVGEMDGFRFALGCWRVIRGFDIGVWGMKEGGARRLIVPPALGYGNNPPRGSGIPVGAILVYVVTVQLVEPPPDDPCG